MTRNVNCGFEFRFDGHLVTIVSTNTTFQKVFCLLTVASAFPNEWKYKILKFHVLILII